LTNNKLEPDDDECLLYDESEYGGNILSIELGNRLKLRVNGDEISSNFERLGSIKCGKDIQKLWIWSRIDQRYIQFLNRGDWSFSNPDIREGNRLDKIFIEKVSQTPWSYTIYGDQNCQGNFFSQDNSI